MTAPIPRDRALLSEASQAMTAAVEQSGLAPGVDLRLRLLEGAAAHIGGYSLKRFDDAVAEEGTPKQLAADATMDLASQLAQAIADCPLHPSLALASLGESDLDPVARRRQGHYFTDSRLALNLTASIRKRVATAESILDPACGAGVLLVSAALQGDPTQRAHIVRHVLWGVDRNPRAVRAARAAIASLTCDLDAVAGLCQHLLVADSLATGWNWWRAHSSEGFDLVIGNPPWEKLKVTRHEHALYDGHRRYYGDDYSSIDLDEEALGWSRRAILRYRELTTASLVHQGPGEADLYKMFVELGAGLTSQSGALAFLIPAGFIRNQGAAELRRWIFSNFDTDILIQDNHERYFQIDSRFKFLRLLATRSSSRNQSIRIGTALSSGLEPRWRVETSLADLQFIQPDLAIPEVRGGDDWELFSRLRHTHPEFGSDEAAWQPQFHREVDMTNDRLKFRPVADGVCGLPVIEGRMVHHHRVSAKRYVSGRGRRAEWQVQLPFGVPLHPQWLIELADLRPDLKDRVIRPRAGFCDITGQTNERTVLAAMIPAGVVCGNKVPTVDFASDEQAYAWVGLANSFVFDWLARRCVTTTLNFFILRSLPIPEWEAADNSLQAIACCSRALANAEQYRGNSHPDSALWESAQLRALIEVLTARLYGISVRDLDRIMLDFPQVDRAQPTLPGEAASSVTRDLIVSSGNDWATVEELEQAGQRVGIARSLGAIPFVPNQHARALRSQP